MNRSNPHYHSEGKGLRKKNNWGSEKELQTNAHKERSHSFCEKTETKRRYSYHDNKILRDEARARLDSTINENTRLSSENNETNNSSSNKSPAHNGLDYNNKENLYENIGSNRCPEIESNDIEHVNDDSNNNDLIDEDRPLERDRERRSVRKLTKDSGYETSPYSEGDYANIDLYSEGAPNSTAETAAQSPEFDNDQHPSLSDLRPSSPSSQGTNGKLDTGATGSSADERYVTNST